MSETTIPACSGRSRRIHTKKCASADKQAGMRIPIRTAEGLILRASPAPEHHGAAIRPNRDLRPLNRGLSVDHARNAVSPRTQPYGRTFRTLVDNHGHQNALFAHGAHQHARRKPSTEPYRGGSRPIRSGRAPTRPRRGHSGCARPRHRRRPSSSSRPKQEPISPATDAQAAPHPA